MKQNKLSIFILLCFSALLLLTASCQKDKIDNNGTTEPTKPIDTNPPADTTTKNPDTVVVNKPAPIDTRFKVVGYLPDWEGAVNDVQYKKLTHIDYAFIIPTNTGGYQTFDDTRLKSMVSAAHTNGNDTKALASIGGGGGGNAFATIVASPALITAFVNSMVSLTDKYNLDGIDIDWEYPNEGTQAVNFLTMMQKLSIAMHNKGRVLTIAVVGVGWDNSIVNGVFDAVDFMNIMAYDDNSFQHSTYEVGVQSLAYWIGRGLPKEKAILGVPFYGRDSTVDYATYNYNDILTSGGNPNLDVFSKYGYNGIITMKSKTSYAMSTGGGMCIWELAGDVNGSNSLLSAINSVITAGGTLSTGAPVGQIITLQGSNGKYVSGENGTAAMTCTHDAAGDSEKFMVVDAGYGKISLKSMTFYMSSEDGKKAINCNRTTPGTWEVFDWIATSDGKVNLRSTSGQFISGEGGLKAMTCTKTTAGDTETFSVNK